MNQQIDDSPEVRCLRCEGAILRMLPESRPDISFFECPVCSRQYARTAGGNLSYRWLHPISLVLYGVLFDPHPLSKATGVAQRLRRTEGDTALKTLVDEIEAELERPTQSVRDILDSVASESECRLFLAAVASEIRTTLPSAPP